MFNQEEIIEVYSMFSNKNSMTKNSFIHAVFYLCNPIKISPPIKNTEKIVFSNASKVFGITNDDILSATRVKHFVKARIFISYFLRSKGFSLKRIGELMKRDHSTIIHHIKTFEDEHKFDEKFRSDYEYFVSVNNFL